MDRRRAPCLLVLAAAVALPAQNSTSKLRAAPGAIAARAGSAVEFRATLADALAEAKAGGKLVLWYVPSVAGSPMDRTAEVDRYLRAGPFSWPSTIALLGARFVCTDEVPRGDLQRRFDLRRQRFIEPGILVLDADGGVRLRLDQITTLHPQWFEAPLRRLTQAPADGFPCAPVLREAWDAYRNGERVAARERAETVLAQGPGPGVAAEAHWLIGASLCRDNRRQEANERWARLAQALPEEPLAWKAAMEVEGHGPFARGFEDYLPLPEALLREEPSDGTRAAVAFAEPELWRRSVAFLLAMDDGDGTVRDSIYDFGGTDSLPNVHAAVTCLVGRALLAAERAAAAGRWELAPDLRARIAAMLARIAANAARDDWLALADRDEIVWARAYAVQFLADWLAREGTDAAVVRPQLQRAASALAALQPDDGAWFHEYPNAFATATALRALHAARAAGASIDAVRVERGLRALARDRTERGAFTYGHTQSGAPRASVEAAAGRMPVCELALLLFGASDDARLQAAVTAGATHHGLLAAVRKYDDHADRLGYGGFFFWFDMLGRAEATMALASADVRARLAAQQRQIVLKLAEFDGCFVDSHELGRAYGTAMALLCCRALVIPPR